MKHDEERIILFEFCLLILNGIFLKSNSYIVQSSNLTSINKTLYKSFKVLINVDRFINKQDKYLSFYFDFG